MEKRNLQRKQNPVWRTLRGGLVLTLAVFFLPAVVFGGAARAESAAQPEQTVEAEAEETAVTGGEAVITEKLASRRTPPVERRKRRGPTHPSP